MATDAKIAPALTAEEWRNFLHSERKTPLPADQVAAYMDASGSTEEEARRVFLHDAAVNLYLAGGVFTREDVETIREAIRDLELADDAMRGSTSTTRLFLANLADRIEALLPPEE